MKYFKLVRTLGGIVLGFVGAFSLYTSVVFAAAPVCNGKAATIYVENGKIVGGSNNGATYAGILNGTNGADVIVGTSGNDTINGGNGEDTICGLGGADTIDGGNNSDWISGGDDNDTINGGNGTDTIFGDYGDDKILGSNGSDVMHGGPGSDFCDQGRGPGSTGCEADSETQGIIEIAQDSRPNSDQDFTFTGDLGEFTLDDQDGGGAQSALGFGKAPGTYTVTQNVVDGWALDGISCYFGTGATTNVAARSVTINLTAGSLVKCYFINTQNVIVDTDNDGINDTVDNCPFVANPGQENNSTDAEGDACDTDHDNDGVLNDDDNCPIHANEDQLNSDGDDDGGNACDTDDDNDGIPDVSSDEVLGDNCPLVFNPEQEDLDEDHVGDICEDDTDGDGVLDNPTEGQPEGDNCPLTPNVDQFDHDQDGLGDMCDVTPNGTGELTVKVEVVNNNDGSSTSSDFQYTISAVDFTTTSVGSFEGTLYTIETGEYVVEGADREGYTKTLSENCSGVLYQVGSSNGENTAVCTITYDDVSENGGGNEEPEFMPIRVVVMVTNDNNNTKVAEDFTVTVTTTGSVTSTSGSVTGTVFMVDPNFYLIDGSTANDYSKEVGYVCSSEQGGAKEESPHEKVSDDVGIKAAVVSEIVCVIYYNDIELVISNEQIINIERNAATVTWTTNHPGTSRVVYGTISHVGAVSSTTSTLSNYEYEFSTTEDGELVREHSVTITGLNANTTYYFRPVSHGSPEVTGVELTATTLSQSRGGGGGGAIPSIPSSTSTGSGTTTTTPPQQVLGERITDDGSDASPVSETQETAGGVLGFTTLPTTGGIDITKFVLALGAFFSIVLGIFLVRRPIKS